MNAASQKKNTRIQEINRERILLSALEVFSKVGYHGARIDQIADGAGMSKPNMLYYFKRKEDIYRAVLERTLWEWLNPLEDLNPDGDPEEELSRYISAKMKMSQSNPKASRLFATEVISGAPILGDFLQGPLRDLVNRKTKVIQSWINAGKLRPIAPHHLLFMIWSTTQHYADFETQVSALTGKSLSDDAFTDQATQAIIEVILGGIRKTPDETAG